mmetsp:Transcript_511/g.467  ORF Transcript_511/g.467 Transcript_511/m.467 type:complete len:188 (+) Transcript_511:44-607(+)
MKTAFTATASLAFILCFALARSALPTPPSINLTDFQGDWYEICAKPVIVEKYCYCTQTVYELDKNGNVYDVDHCRMFSKTGNWINVPSTYYPTNESNAVWDVKVGPVTTGKYYVHEVGPEGNYSYALTGMDNMKDLWVMSKSMTLDNDTVNMLLEKGKSLGYDISDIEYAYQSESCGSPPSLYEQAE